MQTFHKKDGMQIVIIQQQKRETHDGKFDILQAKDIHASSERGNALETHDHC